MGSGGMDGFFAECSFAASLACYAAAAFGCLYALVAAYAARRFAAAANGVSDADTPAVTILKPLHGAEPDLFANLRRFCLQDYPGPVQIVFGVSDRADPAIEVVREIVAAFPGHELKLVINSRRHGSNRKISNLVNMVVEASHDILVISDSDIVVDSAYLKNVVASLQQPGAAFASLGSYLEMALPAYMFFHTSRPPGRCGRPSGFSRSRAVNRTRSVLERNTGRAGPGLVTRPRMAV